MEVALEDKTANLGLPYLHEIKVLNDEDWKKVMNMMRYIYRNE